jgi:hypothetical protein
MRDTEASVGLIRQFDRDLEQFLDEHDPAEFANLEELKRAFFCFMHEKHQQRTAQA